MDETLDYELPTPSPIPSPHNHHSPAAPRSTSTDSVRHIGLSNLAEGGISDTETLPSTPTTNRSALKYGSTRDLPKNWSDDESGTVTEPESVKSGTCVCPCKNPGLWWILGLGRWERRQHHNHEGRIWIHYARRLARPYQWPLH
jgi:hypothetical protein